MYVFAEPMEEEQIEEMQTGERGTVEEFMAKIKAQIYAHRNPDAVVPEAEVEDCEDVAELRETIETGEIAETAEDVEAVAETAETDNATETLVADAGAEFATAEIENYVPQEEEVDDAILKELEDQRDKDEEKDLLGVTLTIKNLVNGTGVKRPTHLQDGDKWEVGYNIAEFSTQARAWSIYSALRTRKKKAFHVRLTSDSDQVGQYQQYIQSLAAEGRDWEKLQDELDSGREKIVFKTRSS